MSLHHAQELDNDLGARPYQNLTLARFLGIVDGIERIVEDAGLDHFGRCCGGGVLLVVLWRGRRTRFSTRDAR